MNVTIMAILLILIVVLTVVTKKVPFNFVLLIIPMVCAMLLGFSVTEVSDFVLEQFASLMKSTGFMLLFAFLYFTMLTETGMFDTIVSALIQKLGNKMNVIMNYDIDDGNRCVQYSDWKLYTGISDHIPDFGAVIQKV